MSDQERFEALGKATSEYGAVKKDLALMWQKAAEMGSHLNKAGMYLTTRAKGSGTKSLWGGDVETGLIERLPSSQDVLRLVGEIMSLVQRKEELAATLRAAGVDPKE